MRLTRDTVVTLGVAFLLAHAVEGWADGLAQQSTVAAPAAMTQDPSVEPTACHEGTGCSYCCCEPVCCPKCVKEEVEKSCWLVKPELVCIPGFRWPWECCDCECTCNCSDGAGGGCACPPRCGRVRCVNVLEQHKYTCEECGYEWEVKCVRCGNGRCCAGGGCPHCGRQPTCASNDEPSGVRLAQATEDATVPRQAKQPATIWEKLGLR